MKAAKAAKPPTKGLDLIGRMDNFAGRLLDEVAGGEGLSDRIAVFERVAKWIEIKHHKLNVGGEKEGSMIDELKRQALKGNASGRAPRGRAKPAATSSDPQPASSGAGDGDTGGDDLAALKLRLPGANHGGPVGNRHDARGADYPHDGDDRGVHSGLLVDSESDPDDADGDC